MRNGSFPPTGEITIPDEITFQLEDAVIPVFTLTCTSTGGPVSTVSWRRDGTMLSDDSTYSITSQILVDAETATYTHTLTVTGRLVGEYQCNVSNNKPSSASRMLAIVGENFKYTCQGSTRSASQESSDNHNPLYLFFFLSNSNKCLLKYSTNHNDLNNNQPMQYPTYRNIGNR